MSLALNRSVCIPLISSDTSPTLADWLGTNTETFLLCSIIDSDF